MTAVVDLWFIVEQAKAILDSDKDGIVHAVAR
jgi:hypothetical protein